MPAAQRGVDVRVIQPAVSDVEIVRTRAAPSGAGFSAAACASSSGTSGILHSKSAVIDDRWSTIGSYNLDYISLRYNLEVNVAIRDQTFAAAHKRSFLQDFAACREVELGSFEGRPWLERMLEGFLYRVRRFLCSPASVYRGCSATL